MAHRIKELPSDIKEVTRRHSHSGSHPQYPWKLWFDGSWWALAPGEDFTCSIKGFGIAARSYGRANGYRVSIIKGGIGVCYLKAERCTGMMGSSLDSRASDELDQDGLPDAPPTTTADSPSLSESATPES